MNKNTTQSIYDIAYSEIVMRGLFDRFSTVIKIRVYPDTAEYETQGQVTVLGAPNIHHKRWNEVADVLRGQGFELIITGEWKSFD